MYRTDRQTEKEARYFFRFTTIKSRQSSRLGANGDVHVRLRQLNDIYIQQEIYIEKQIDCDSLSIGYREREAVSTRGQNQWYFEFKNV